MSYNQTYGKINKSESKPVDKRMNNGQIINRMLRMLSGNYKADPTFRRDMIDLIEQLR